MTVEKEMLVENGNFLLTVVPEGIKDLIFCGKKAIATGIVENGIMSGGISLWFPFGNMGNNFERVIFYEKSENGIIFVLKKGFAEEYSFNFDVLGGISFSSEGDAIIISFEAKRIDELVIDIPINPCLDIFFEQETLCEFNLGRKNIPILDIDGSHPLDTVFIGGTLLETEIYMGGDFLPDKSEIQVACYDKKIRISPRLLRGGTSRQKRIMEKDSLLKMEIILKFKI